MEDYAQTTKHTCLCFAVITFLSFIFILSPIGDFRYISFLGKIFIICVIVYLVKFIIIQNYQFYMKYQSVSNDSTIQMNIWTNNIFVVTLVILCFSIFNTFTSVTPLHISTTNQN